MLVLHSTDFQTQNCYQIQLYTSRHEWIGGGGEITYLEELYTGSKALDIWRLLPFKIQTAVALWNIQYHSNITPPRPAMHWCIVPYQIDWYSPKISAMSTLDSHSLSQIWAYKNVLLILHSSQRVYITPTKKNRKKSLAFLAKLSYMLHNTKNASVL